MIYILQQVFLWFYCLDIPDAILVIALATSVLLVLHKRFRIRAWWKWLMGAALVCWILIVVCVTVGMRGISQNPQHSFIPFHSYHKILNGGNPEIYRSNFMNVMLFYPAGLIGVLWLPSKWSGCLRCVCVILVLSVMSIGIEYLQYHFVLGRCEVDDVIHNTMGAVLGSLIAVCIPKGTMKR